MCVCACVRARVRGGVGERERGTGEERETRGDGRGEEGQGGGEGGSAGKEDLVGLRGVFSKMLLHILAHELGKHVELVAVVGDAEELHHVGMRSGAQEGNLAQVAHREALVWMVLILKLARAGTHAGAHTFDNQDLARRAALALDHHRVLL